MIFSLEERQVMLAGDNFVAHDATVIGAVSLGRGTSVWFKSVIRGDLDGIRIGEASNIQDACVLHVDIGMPLEVGDGVSVGHQAVLHGCTVRDGALVGINAVVLDGAVVGEQALIGANTLVPPGKVIPPRTLALGSPARVVRDLSQEEIKMTRKIAEHYHELGRRYQQSLVSQSNSEDDPWARLQVMTISGETLDGP